MSVVEPLNEGIDLPEHRDRIADLSDSLGYFARVHLDGRRLGDVSLTIRPSVVRALRIQRAEREAAKAQADRGEVHEAALYVAVDSIAPFRLLFGDGIDP